MGAIFGPAGTSDSFSKMGFKNSLQVPDYIEKMGLDAFEYQCGRGVNIGEEKARSLGKLAKEKNIALSLHAPYYISMSSTDEEKRLNSVNYILASANAVNFMGGNRIIVHTGSCGKISREEALELAKDTINNGASWTFEQQSVTGRDSRGYVHMGTIEDYVMIPDENSINTAKSKIKEIKKGK